MTLSVPYRFGVVLCRADGTYLGTAQVTHDFEPANEWARVFLAGKLGILANGSASTVIPLFDSTVGEPYCRGFRIEVAQRGGDAVGADFANTHFREYAAAAASRFVAQKKLRVGETYTYLVVAYRAPVALNSGGLSVTDVSPDLPVQNASLDDFMARATAAGTAEIEHEDLPVFVSRRVLEEAAAQTHAEEGTETGGILIGKLWRDVSAREIFVEITAMVPAEHTKGTNVKLTFTPQTWAAADAALRLRARGEQFAGYIHSHPVKSWCEAKGCTLEAQRTCHLAKDFFSADDEAVMRAAFPRAYNIAIVANDTAFTDITFSMFGNRKGITQPRGFYVLEEKHHGA